MSDKVSVEYSAAVDGLTILSPANIINCLDALWIKILKSVSEAPTQLELHHEAFRYYLAALPWERRIVGRKPPSLPYMVIRDCEKVYDMDAKLNNDLSGIYAQFLLEDGTVLGILTK